MPRTIVVLCILLLLLVVVFTLQNAAPLEVRFLFFSFTMSQALVIFLSCAVGFLSGFLLGSVRSGIVGRSGPKR